MYWIIFLGEPESKCMDTNANCKFFESIGGCNSASLKEQCQKTCNLCDGKTSSTTTTTTTVESCGDNHSSCSKWAGMGYCTETYVGYMTENCKKSCNLCGGTTSTTSTTTETTTTADSCKDKNSSCGKWAKRGFCTGTYETYMNANCKKSCNVC